MIDLFKWMHFGLFCTTLLNFLVDLKVPIRRKAYATIADLEAKTNLANKKKEREAIQKDEVQPKLSVT